VSSGAESWRRRVSGATRSLRPGRPPASARSTSSGLTRASSRGSWFRSRRSSWVSRRPPWAAAFVPGARGLRHVVVRAAGEAAHAVGLAGTSGDDDDREGGVDARGEPVGAADPVEQGEAAAVLEHEVEDDEVRLSHLDGPQPLARGARSGYAKAVRREVLGQEGTGGVVVLDDEHGGAVGVHGPLRRRPENLTPRPEMARRPAS